MLDNLKSRIRSFSAQFPQVGDLLENDWLHAGVLVVLILFFEIAAGLFLMDRVTEDLETQRRLEFIASWESFLAQRKIVHESKVTGYAWWGDLARAVRAGDKLFINVNIGEDASLVSEYDFVWLAGRKGRTYFAAVDGTTSLEDAEAIEALRRGELEQAFVAFADGELELAREVAPARRVALERPIVAHEFHEYNGQLRLLTVSPICDNLGYPSASGYFVFGTNLTRVLKSAEEVIPVRLSLAEAPPQDAYHVETLQTGSGDYYLVFEPDYYIADVGQVSLYLLILVQILLVVGAGAFAVPYFARRRGRRLKSEVANRTRLLEEARRAAEADRRELVQISDISRQINATRNLDEVLDQVFAYFLQEFDIEAVIVLLADSEKNELYSYRTTEPANATPAMIEYSRGLRVPLRAESILQRTFLRKRPFFLSKIDARAFPAGSERDIIDTLSLKSFLLVPLVIRDASIAMILFTSYDKRLRLGRGQIDRIARFCNQIAGAIYHSSLLRQVEEERSRSETARRDAERSKAELSQVNEISRQLNATVDLNQVLEGIRTYFRENFDINNLWLQLVDEKHQEFYTYKVLASEADDEIINFLYGLRQSMGEEAGLVWYTYTRRRPLYIRRVQRPTYATEDDRLIVETLQIKSTLQIPLMIRDTVTGILHVTSFRRQLELRKGDIESINRFAQQIAGAVHTARLFEQAEIARLGTEVSRMNAERAQKKADGLLLNILPEKIAEELKERGEVTPLEYDSVTVMFTDFVGFTRIGEQLPADELIRELDGCFSQFDDVSLRNNLEKLKTIGDAYMCAGGLPDPNRTHAVDACLAALEFQHFMDQMRDIKSSIGLDFWELRVGIHTGPLTAGVVGKKKFAYDIWGDTVNTASRMESHGAASRVNISEATYEQVRYFFACEHRGKVEAKGKGKVDMYFVHGIHPRLSRDGEGRIPNDEFRALYEKVRSGAVLRYKSEV